MDAKVEPQRQVMRLRGRSYVAFVFSPFMPIMNWLEEIDATLAQSPGFFAGRPIVLDLAPTWFGVHISVQTVTNLTFIIVGALICALLIYEPRGFARLWAIAKEKLRLWPYPY